MQLFEVLNSEEKAEHKGFRKALQTLFPIFYRSELGFSDTPDYLEFFYDDMLMNLDLDRASRFFWWLGVIKEEYAPALSSLHSCGKCGATPSPPGKFCEKCGEKIMTNWQDDEAFICTREDKPSAQAFKTEEVRGEVKVSADNKLRSRVLGHDSNTVAAVTA